MKKIYSVIDENMTYQEYRERISVVLRENPLGLTWKSLKAKANLSQKSACPEWTKRLETDIGLIREKGKGNALIWKL